jgi:hypothetical protein
MNNIYPILLGISGQLYNKIHEDNTKLTEIITESIKALIITFYTLTAKDNFLFGITSLTIYPFILNNDPFWKSFSSIIGIILILSFLDNDILSNTIYDYMSILLCIIIIVIFTRLYNKYDDNEKYPFTTLAADVILLCVLIILFFTLPDTNTFIYDIILVSFGILFVNILNKLIVLFSKNRRRRDNSGSFSSDTS